MDKLYFIVKGNEILACRASFSEAFELSAFITGSDIKSIEINKIGPEVTSPEHSASASAA